MRLFGTDGIRAPFGEAPLDRSTVTRISVCLGEMLKEVTGSPEVVLAGDTRESTPQLCQWLMSGLRTTECRIHFGGTLPTAAVARLVESYGADAGIAVSASHNVWTDNGIKFFGATGFKWHEDREIELENRLLDCAVEATADDELPAPDPALTEAYVQALKASLPRPVELRQRIVVDCGHGAAAQIAPLLFRELGAEVLEIGTRPNGRNINVDCGSTTPEVMAQQVVRNGADFGVAFDGDADRAIFADESGAILDGDAILYMWARSLHARGLLRPPTIVATTMSNLGLEKALAAEHIQLVRCGVGDRTVVETMRDRNVRLGGEQSGHIVHLGLSSTGDGLLTALHIAAISEMSEAPLSTLAAGFRRFPQILINIPVSRKPEFESLPEVAELARATEQQLGNTGRLVLRYSGTEPLARVMIEGENQSRIEALAARLATQIQRSIGCE